MIVKTDNPVSRRDVLGGLSGLLALGVFPQILSQRAFANRDSTKLPRQEYWVSAQGDSDESYGISWGAANTAKNNTTSLTGFRGHGACQHPIKPASALLFSRRPGTQGVEVNLTTGHIDATFNCGADRHLFGHGCFGADGKVLYTSESDYRTGKGKIGIRDALNYQLLGEYESYGVGPHEIKLLPDGKTLVVANGGIRTHPDSGRKKTNLATMSPSLTYIDLNSGKKLDDFRLHETKASIRHLDVAADGSVVFAMQVQRSAVGHGRTLPLAGIHKPGRALRLLDEPAVIIDKMNDYMGSVAINNLSRIAGFTSPRGNIVTFWHIDSGEFIGYHSLRDVCGIAVSVDQRNFIVSNSFGQLRQLDAKTLTEDKGRRQQIPGMRLDNHLLLVDVV